MFKEYICLVKQNDCGPSLCVIEPFHQQAFHFVAACSDIRCRQMDQRPLEVVRNTFYAG